MTEQLTTFAYAVEGETTSGTIEQYAQDYAQSHYCALSISPKGQLLNTDGDPLPVTITRKSWDGGNDYFFVQFEADFPNGPEYAQVRIDGRA